LHGPYDHSHVSILQRSFDHCDTLTELHANSTSVSILQRSFAAISPVVWIRKKPRFNPAAIFRSLRSAVTPQKNRISVSIPQRSKDRCDQAERLESILAGVFQSCSDLSIAAIRTSMTDGQSQSVSILQRSFDRCDAVAEGESQAESLVSILQRSFDRCDDAVRLLLATP